MSLLNRLEQSRAVRFVLNELGGRSAASRLLRTFPLGRTLPSSGLRYRIKSIESLLIEDEVLKRRTYASAMPKDVRTFVDLGSNVGFFVALVADHTGRRDLKGLAVDADPAMYAETRWLLETNRLEGVKALHALAGAPGEKGEGEFFVNGSNIASSAHRVGDPTRPLKPWVSALKVPTIDLEETWVRHFGDIRCDVLKIDIEGSEREFLQPGNRFIDRVDRILLEFHEYIVSFEDVDAKLNSYGFRLSTMLEKLENRGVGCWTRQQ